ncbi:MAG: sensor histidine kinase [Actinobacteria bacterium]|nr:MAG: sensor histidine kinase [Actinomycetota bacterium]
MIFFALSGMAAVALLGLVAVGVLQDTGRSEAIRNAKTTTELAGRGIAQPALTPALLRGAPSAIPPMDRIIRTRVLRDPVVRVKIWDASGRVLYSDEHRLIGQRYTLPPEELEALRTGGVAAEVSDLKKPENRFDRSQGKLLEVYLGVRGPGGARLLFESYLRYSSVAASGRRLWEAFTPALLTTLLLLELVQIPLAWSLARRLQRSRLEREALLRRSIEASDQERRRIARDLHDGVVQNLAGVSYTLSAAGDRAARADPSAGEMVEDAAAETRKSIRELRTLLVDLYPPALERAGLQAALSDLVTPLTAENVQVELDVQAGLDVPNTKVPILYRAAQEALRNTMAHADAHRVRVHASRQNGQAVLSVEDDGKGFDVQEAERADGGRPHFGLRMLADLAKDAGGELSVDSHPGAGTRVRMQIPIP